MSSGFFRLISDFKVPVVLVATTGFFAFDTWRMKSRKDSFINVKLGSEAIPGVIGPRPSISPTLQEMIDEVRTQLNLPQDNKKSINYYSTAKPKPHVNGFYSSYSQVDVFIPDYFNILTLDQLNARAIYNLLIQMGCNCETLGKDDWITPDGISLFNSFLLSERAKKFLIAQCSYSHFNIEYFLKYLVFSLVSLGSIVAFSLAEERVAGARNLKTIFAFMLMIPLAVIYNLLKGHSELICESKGIGQAISRNVLSFKDLTGDPDPDLIDEEMLRGALEYYKKLDQRNRAIYRLFNSGFSFSAMMGGNNEVKNPFKLELPKKEIVDILEKILKTLEDRKKCNPNDERQT